MQMSVKIVGEKAQQKFSRRSRLSIGKLFSLSKRRFVVDASQHYVPDENMEDVKWWESFMSPKKHKARQSCL